MDDDDAKFARFLVAELRSDLDRVEDSAMQSARRVEGKLDTISSSMVTLHTDLARHTARSDEKFANVERRLDDLDGEVGDTGEHTRLTLQAQKEAAEKKLAEHETAKAAEVTKKADARRAFAFQIMAGMILLLLGSLVTIGFQAVARKVSPPASAATR